MKIFQCTSCFQPVFFENSYCENCNSTLGYLDSNYQMVALNSAQQQWTINGIDYKFCKNKNHHVCNWLVPAASISGYCTACDLNKTIPNISIPENYKRWQKLELAKHRLIYSLQKLNLPIVSKHKDEENGLAFDFLSAKVKDKDGKPIMTGHMNGLITIVLSEADSVSREQIRKSLKEPYRTLAGHFRHEVAHYYWTSLVFQKPEVLQAFRDLFGDETVSYKDSLETYYKNGAPENWRTNFISKYATAHPWEDWAETWAHYLHIINTMDTAYHFGLNGDPHLPNTEHMEIISFDPYQNVEFKKILEETVPLFFAINSLNRSMGIPDIYPFVISDAVKVKLEFIHRLLLNQRFS
ncbi:zinc-binding metallopeptidase family protein [Jiulongibacter sp. NS-SX5]|uniref:zinc-binding metallopeptidase family protein n=1 Tax=Jiulongibacter sp. NS-SX5 TaxID=3463854 RepID=UPI00405937C3